jgi:hypothetical protein
MAKVILPCHALDRGLKIFHHILHRHHRHRCLHIDRIALEGHMPNLKATKFILKYVRFFETASLIFAVINIANVVIELYFLFVKENWFTGAYRSLHIVMLQFFVASSVIGYAAKTGFAIIRESSNKGNLKTDI